MPANLNPSNRPVRTRMPGGVAGDAENYNLRAPMPISNEARNLAYWVAITVGARWGDSLVNSRPARLVPVKRLRVRHIKAATTHTWPRKGTGQANSPNASNACQVLKRFMSLTRNSYSSSERTSV